MRHPTRKAIDKFNSILSLQEDPHLQDWEIECANPNRVNEFIHCYNTNTKNDDERFTLMALILGSFEEYHDVNPPSEEIWTKVKTILIESKIVHYDHIEYYQCLDATKKDEFFPITELMREIEI